MTDRELLERAAKAAGYMTPPSAGWLDAIVICTPERGAQKWNPLLDDGDALRLAVKLGLWVEQIERYAVVSVPYGERINVAHGADPYAATRRAIVRAAAAMADDAKPE